MTSIKCPHCGLVNFSAAGNCKRCQNDLAATADSGSSGLAPDSIEESSFRFQSEYPLAAWLLTLVLLISNTSLSYAIAGRGSASSARILGGVIGGVVAWPFVLLVVYVVSKKFREKNSLHAVINYGLALNTLISGCSAR